MDEQIIQNPFCFPFVSSFQVAAVVSASGEAGFTVEQTAAAAVESGLAAAKKEAMGATTASPLKMVGQALQGADG